MSFTMSRVSHLFVALLSLLAASLLSLSPAQAELGKGFVSATASVNGARLHYIKGGSGPALILIHGFPQDWHAYQAIMPRLAKSFTVIAVDLRGIGRSRAVSGGFDAATMAEDIHQLTDKLKLDHAYVVGHDIGGMVAYAMLRRYPQTLRGAMILDAPIPGIAGWSEVISHPKAWHVGFMQVPGLAEKLVRGRRAEYLGYFFAMSRFTPREAAQYVKAYASREQFKALLDIYRAFPANEAFNQAATGKVDVSLFVAVGEKSPFVALAPKFVEGLRAAGVSKVESGLVPGAMHYLTQDQPEAVADLIEHHATPR